MDIPQPLLHGYRQFRAERYSVESERYRALQHGQTPQTMVIGCADSRVDPATIFSARPGELFVVRNVAALVPPYEETGTYHGTSAALEYAVRILKAEHIVVLGHGLCGGVAAALAAAEHQSVGGFITPWVELLADVRDDLLRREDCTDAATRQRRLEHLAVLKSLENLMTFPFISKAVAEGRLTLDGAWFSIAEGQLLWFDKDCGEFCSLPD